MLKYMNMKPFIFISFAAWYMFTCSCQNETGWKDINYAGDTMNFHKMDIYLPAAHKKMFPAVILIYGSAWFGNNLKGTDMKTIGRVLLNNGYAVITPNHRSSRDSVFPAQIHDIKAVIRFIRANADMYLIDTSFIAITGSSSGGHLAALAGTSAGITNYSLLMQSIDLEGKVGDNLNFKSTVDAVVDWFGPTDFLVMDSCGSSMNHNAPDSPESSLIGGPVQENTELCALANPVTYVDPTDPPFLIFHGDADPLVPWCQSELLYQALRKANVQCKLIIIPDAKHGPGVFEEKYFKMMIDFLNNSSGNN
jgi:acetyl esterase/lipase